MLPPGVLLDPKGLCMKDFGWIDEIMEMVCKISARFQRRASKGYAMRTCMNGSGVADRFGKTHSRHDWQARSSKLFKISTQRHWRILNADRSICRNVGLVYAKGV